MISSRSTASFSFAPNASDTPCDTSGDIFNPVDVSTAGTAAVKSFGAPFLNRSGRLSSLTADPAVYGGTELFASYATPANICVSLNGIRLLQQHHFAVVCL